VTIVIAPAVYRSGLRSNSVLRKAMKNHKVLPTDQAAAKVVFLATQAGIEEMEHADSGLEARVESIYSVVG